MITMKSLIALFLLLNCIEVQLEKTAENDLELEVASNSSRNLCECGVKSRLTSRIIGGERSDIKEHPWMVGISVFGNIVCGGALLNEEYILTAAHCFKISSVKSLAKVRVGFSERQSSIPDLKIAEIISHENYIPNRSGLYDIALVRLASPLTLNSSISPICLSSIPSENYVGQKAIVTGWGVVDKKNEIVSNYLQAASVHIIPIKDCIRTYRKAKKKVTDNNICAGGTDGKDACQGDSGSPLVVEVNEKHTVIGIVSWGIGCAGKYPGVYTNVYYYLPWIKQHFHSAC
ncbi:hypothetical protein CHUAL_013793 [Chamberlinius hualienensis]